MLMNNKYLKWAILSVKRCLLRGTFYLSLLVMILTVLIIGQVEKNRNGELRVILYSEDEVLGNQVTDRLIALKNNKKNSEFTSKISFEKVKSEDVLKTEIIRGEAICGLFFEKDFTKNALSDFPDEDIVIYMSADSVEGYAIREIVFPYIVECMGPDMLEGYLKENEIELSVDERTAIIDRCLDILKTQELSIFKVEDIDIPDEGEENAHDTPLSILPFFVAVMFIIVTVVSVFEGNAQNKALFSKITLFDRIVFMCEQTIISVGIQLCVVSLLLLLQGYH